MGRIDRTARYGIVLAMTGAIAMSPIALGSAHAQSVAQLESVVDRSIDASPRRDSSAYSPPSQDTVDGIVAGVSGLMGGGDAAVDAYDRVAVEGGMTALVEEGDPHAGNGMYAVRDDADEKSLIVQIPHPIAEFEVEKMGTQLFSESESSLFMLAGAHRTAGGGAADVAHREDTAFAAVNEAVVKPGTTVVQIHGFSEANHQTELGDVVLSSAQGDPSPAVRRLDEDLRGGGFETCLHDGEKCKQLAGTTNVEADAAREHGAEFIHIEVNQDVRRDAGERTRLVDMIAESLKASGVG